MSGNAHVSQKWLYLVVGVLFRRQPNPVTAIPSLVWWSRRNNLIGVFLTQFLFIFMSDDDKTSGIIKILNGIAIGAIIAGIWSLISGSKEKQKVAKLTQEGLAGGISADKITELYIADAEKQMGRSLTSSEKEKISKMVQKEKEKFSKK